MQAAVIVRICTALCNYTICKNSWSCKKGIWDGLVERVLCFEGTVVGIGTRLSRLAGDGEGAKGNYINATPECQPPTKAG